MSAPGRRRPSRAGSATVETALVGAVLVVAVLATSPSVPEALARGLGTALARLVAAIGAPLP